MANGSGRRCVSVSRTRRDQQWRDLEEADAEEEDDGDEFEVRVLRLSAARAARPPRSMADGADDEAADDEADDDDDEDDDDEDDADDDEDANEDNEEDVDDDDDDVDDDDEAEELADMRRRRCGRGNTQTQTHHAGFSVRQTMRRKTRRKKNSAISSKAIHPAKRTQFAFHRYVLT